MRKGTLFWGVLLVLVGLILLLDNLGLLGNINIWNLIWPLILILLGLRILYGTAFRQQTATEHATVSMDGAQRASIKMQHAAGRLNIHTGAEGDTLIEGEFGGGVEVESHRQGESLSVRLSVPKNIFPFDWIPGGTLDWSVALNGDVPIALEFETGAGESNLDLRELRITDLRLKSGASSTQIQMPSSAGFTRVNIEAGAASVTCNIPSGVAARIRSEGGLSSINVDQNRFPMQGSHLYQSVDYESAENKIEMDIRMGVGSVDVR